MGFGSSCHQTHPLPPPALPASTPLSVQLWRAFEVPLTPLSSGHGGKWGEDVRRAPLAPRPVRGRARVRAGRRERARGGRRSGGGLAPPSHSCGAAAAARAGRERGPARRREAAAAEKDEEQQRRRWEEEAAAAAEGARRAARCGMRLWLARRRRAGSGAG
ncbi:translation initiation factor IF-2-like [Strigops habroptila]|uniref:translation initiation factor IF-2-like n=1 Tax=Strigops habroptila TaxID=2489341 RepID=UPI0011D03338|nr:translation initiation factor IF-2-like [Strigops habroptila]